MKLGEIKTSATAKNQVQTKRPPFFLKEGQDSFFSKSNEHSECFFNSSPIQTKLTIGQPNDKYEVEADVMADKVVKRLSESNRDVSKSNSNSVIRRKCSSCEEEELQRKEEGTAETPSVEIRRKPIFENNTEGLDADVQTKPIAALTIQAKCSNCEQEEKLQKKEEDEPLEIEESFQRKTNDMSSENPPNLESRLSSSKYGGSALPTDVQASMGSAFGADFSNVRVHTGSEAIQMSQNIGAQAFTHGSDIYFNEGKYDTNSRSGRHLLAHELTHTVQQGFSSINESPNIQKNGEACYPENDSENEAPTCDIDYSQHEEIFTLSGISLETEDLLEVAGYFPDGIQLNSSELFVLVQGEGFANSIRVNGYRVNSNQSVNSGVNVFVFQIGKGRAIMVSSRVGGSIMLDAGSGTSRTSNSVRARQIARDVRNVLLSGLASAPSRITISHVDLDHYNAVQEVLNLPEMRSADVRISRQQLMEAMRSGNWQTMNIQFNQQQNLIRINVAGTRGVHIDRAYIGGMEVTEFRSVRAHQELTNTNRTTYNKNSTSEITVVRDFLTNTTHVFTGDGEGRTFSEIIDMVGSRAFQRIIGGGSRNLASVEFPHHGGAVTSGPNTRGMIRFLKLAFEASNGRVNFFAQTNQRFSGTDSASINYLDVAEVPVQRVLEGSPNATRVQRISGGTQEQITIDRGRITQILNAGNANASRVMDAQQTRHKLASLVELVEPVQRMLSLEGTRAEFRQLGEAASGVKTNIQNSQTSLNTSWNQFWQTMEAEAGSTGMRGSTPIQRIRQALNTLQTQVRETNVQSLENDVTSIYNGLNIYQRLLTNALAMSLALNEGRIGDLQNLKVEQRRLLSRSISILGRAEVSRQVREAWRTIREVWTGRMIRSVARRLGHYSAAHRHMMTDFRVVLNENIVNQARLNQLVEQARHGALPMSPGRTVPMRSRIGAGFMAAIEVLRIGLEFYEAMEAAEEAEELRDIRGRAEGLQDINWWKHQGAHPSIELVERGSLYGWNIVSSHLSNNAKYEILNEEYSGEAPEFDKVVVTNVSNDDLSYVVGKMTIELITLNDWVSNYGHPESGSGVIKKFNNGWGVKLWNEEDGGYQYYLKTVIQEPLDALYDTITQNLEEELEHEATDSDNRLATISNTAIFGTDRYIYVYDGSSLRRLDFEDRTPKFFVNAGHAPTNHELREVRAADTYTYNILSQYNTISIQDGIPYNTFNIYRNSRGIGYVESDDIIYYMANNLGQTIRDMAVQMKPLTNEALIQPKCNDCEEDETQIHTKFQDSDSVSSDNIERKLNASKGNGDKMDEGVRKEMSTAFNANFDSVNIHTDDAAVQMNKDLNAQAFTHGSDIYFNKDKYDTNSDEGKHLLAHELTHTVQQGESNIAPKIQRDPGDDNEFTAPEPNEESLVISDEELSRLIQSEILSVTFIVGNYGGLRGLERSHPQSYQVARSKMQLLLGEEKLQAIYNNEQNIRDLAHRSELIEAELFDLLEHYNETNQAEAYNYINEIMNEYDFSYSSIIALIDEIDIGVLVVLNLFIGGNPDEVSLAIERQAEAIQAQQLALERERAAQTEIAENYVGDVIGTQEVLFWWDDTVTLESLLEPTYGYNSRAEALVWARMSGKAVAVKEIQERFYIFQLNYQYSYANLQAWSDTRRTDFVRNSAGRNMNLVTTDGVVLNPGRGQSRFYGESQYNTGEDDFSAAANVLEENAEDLSYNTQYSLFKDMVKSLAFQNLQNAKIELGQQLDTFFQRGGMRMRMFIDSDVGASLMEDTSRLRDLLGDAAILGNRMGETSTESDQEELLNVLAEIGEIQTNNPVASLFINDTNEEDEAASRENIENNLEGSQPGDAAWTAASELGRRMNNVEIVQRYILQNPDAVLKLTPLHAQVISRFEPSVQSYIRLRLGVHSILDIAQSLGLAVAEISVAIAGFVIGGPVGIALTLGGTAYGASQAIEAFEDLNTLRAMSQLDVQGRLQFASQEQVESAEFWAYVGAGLTLLDIAGFSSSVRAMTRVRGVIDTSADLASVNARTQQNLSQVAELMGETDQSLVARLNAATGSERTRLNREIAEIIEVVGPHGDEMRSIGWVSDETIDMFRRNPDLIDAYANNPSIRALLKHCHSPCFPESLIPEQIEHMEDFLEELADKGLALSDINVNSQRLRASFEAASEDEAWEIIARLERELDNKIQIIGDTRRGSALYDESDLGSVMDDGLSRIEGRHMTSVQGAHDVGVSMGREYAEQTLGLTDSGWVNPFQFRRSRFGQGFDDVLEDSSGNLWIVEYKGGTAELSPGQMSASWVTSRILRYRREGGIIGEQLADRLDAARSAGKLRGIALSTPISGRTPEQTIEIGRWTY